MTRKSKRQISKNKKRFSKKGGEKGENPIGAKKTLKELASESARNLTALPITAVNRVSKISDRLLGNVEGIAENTGNTAEAVVKNVEGIAEHGTNIARNIAGVGDDLLETTKNAVHIAGFPFAVLGNRAVRSKISTNAETERKSINQENKTESEKQMQDDNIRLLNAESLLNINRRRSNVYESEEETKKKNRRIKIDALNDTRENDEKTEEINVKHRKVMDDIKKEEIKNKIDAKKAEIFRDMALVELYEEKLKRSVDSKTSASKTSASNVLESLNHLNNLVKNNLNAHCKNSFFNMKRCSSNLDKRAYYALKHLKDKHTNINWDWLVLKASMAAHEVYNKQGIPSAGGRKTKHRNRKKKRKTKRRNKRKYSRRN